ncbi:NAD(P)H-dependent amine dehydrogenase family protein [Sinomicrobium weinanense]|uniref:Dihydrodipicolinate reductase n=1 Tax=Sinomicrobium weinanense TaxID=2842200 RepID=A0A926JRQ8_9FLAO|nr:dihydrodipicolinate reductase [Sinomicrobium weinanense]MBC9796156.1 dihydrodipicolinate reductase [Sinomicrobium weinanense]MBU3121907.1 hypothetical protein [Sinomicrobium weinanense]
MSKIKIVQIGMGPLGLKIAEFIAQRPGLKTVAAVDTGPEIIGKSLRSFSSSLNADIIITGDLDKALETRPDVAVLATVSDIKRITGQIKSIVREGIPVVSTCEELSFPFDTAPGLAAEIDAAARENGVAVVGTGVNPGFLMDALPAFMTSVCQHVERIKVKRYQDASSRRIPFQDKIGAGLSPEGFEAARKKGTLRHVGLTESVHFIAGRLGWKLERTEDIISPVFATADISLPSRTIKKGDAAGVRQVGRGFMNGQARVELVFQAAVGEPESYDEIEVIGTPGFVSRIGGGVNGDTATCAITVNAINSVIHALPGLRTMADIPMTSYSEYR